MMYTAVEPLSKYLQLKSVRIYDVIFALHTKCTVVVLMTCSFLLSAKQYFGEPIKCVGDMKDLEYANSYCWTMGTYILNYYDLNEANFSSNSVLKTTRNGIAEGVGTEIPGVTERLYLRYYQWIILLLLMQSGLFFFPAFLWKLWEGQRLEQLCESMRCPVVDEETHTLRLNALFKYFLMNNHDLHVSYMLRYIFCELLNLLISVINILLLNVFFDGFWFKYVKAILAMPSYEWKTWNHFSSRIFPKISKCSIPKFGQSGSSQNYDLLCILPLNILNEKIFAFLWFWFLLITALAALNLLCRVILLCFPQLRILLLNRHVRSLSRKDVALILSKFSMGDWFLLLKVAVNINPILFHDLLCQLCEYRKNEINTSFV